MTRWETLAEKAREVAAKSGPRAQLWCELALMLGEAVRALAEREVRKFADREIERAIVGRDPRPDADPTDREWN